MKNISTLLESLLLTIPQIIVFIFSVKYYLLTKSRNSIYLLVGSILTVLWVFFSYSSFLLYMEFGLEAITVGVIGGIVNLLGLVGAFLFAFGLRAFVKKYLDLILKRKTDTIDHIGNS